MSRGQRAALVFGTVLLLAGAIGFVEVGSFLQSAGCPQPGIHGCSNPAPLSNQNATLAIVGSVISMGVLFFGGVVTFIAMYFPDPRTPASRADVEEDRTGPVESSPGPAPERGKVVAGR